METEKQTQRRRVEERLLQERKVDNFWAIQNYILRLGAIIFELRHDGWVIDGAFGKALGYEKPLWKNWYYILRATPGQGTLL